VGILQSSLGFIPNSLSAGEDVNTEALTVAEIFNLKKALYIRILVFSEHRANVGFNDKEQNGGPEKYWNQESNIG